MRSIDRETLILINEKICKLYNQKSKLINPDNLDSCFSVFDSYYNTEEEIICAFFRAICTSHAFQDANKRTASVALWYLKPGKISALELASIAKETAVNTKISIKELVERIYRIPLNESILPTYTFSYKGPVYRFEKVYTVLDKPIYTTAQNEKQAATVLKGKLKKEFGFDYNAKLDIDEDKIKLVDVPNKEYQFFNSKKRKEKDYENDKYAKWIGSKNNKDIYFVDGKYMLDDMEFSSIDELEDYLED